MSVQWDAVAYYHIYNHLFYHVFFLIPTGKLCLLPCKMRLQAKWRTATTMLSIRLGHKTLSRKIFALHLPWLATQVQDGHRGLLRYITGLKIATNDPQLHHAYNKAHQQPYDILMRLPYNLVCLRRLPVVLSFATAIMCLLVSWIIFVEIFADFIRRENRLLSRFFEGFPGIYSIYIF